jgi:site-specific recombinase XerD
MSLCANRRLQFARQGRRQSQDRLAAGSKWADFGLVFTTRKGTPLGARDVVLDFKSVLEDAKLPSTIRFHDLRHSAASLLLAQGVQMRVVMELLGHSTIKLTAGTYSHVFPEVMRDAANARDKALNSM